MTHQIRGPIQQVQTPDGVVYMHPAAQQNGFGMVPTFPQMAVGLDTIMQRVPWWMLLAGAVVLVYRYGPRRG